MWNVLGAQVPEVRVKKMPSENFFCGVDIDPTRVGIFYGHFTCLQTFWNVSRHFYGHVSTGFIYRHSQISTDKYLLSLYKQTSWAFSVNLTPMFTARG